MLSRGDAPAPPANPFQHLRAEVDRAARALGGSPGVWEAVANEFDRQLLAVLAERRNCEPFRILFLVGRAKAETPAC
jgi:chorismate mutase